jgi:shikimate dehydrogenase
MAHAEPARIADLVRRGILDFAMQPPMNPRHLDFPRYTVPLIAHDYPAKTAAMWNSAYQAFGMDAGNVMMTGDPGNAPLIFQTLRRDSRYIGGGAGVGFKEKAFELADEFDAFASGAGAVNFVSKSGGTLCGHNTDGIGFAAALEHLMRRVGRVLQDNTVLLLGAGGTARSVAVALAGRGARLRIVNRTAGRATALAERLNRDFAQPVAAGAGEEELGRLAAMADVIVNVSTKGAAGPLAQYSALAPADNLADPGTLHRNLTASGDILDRLPRTAIVCDVVIAHGGTPLLRQARERGFPVLDGIAMVINQGVEAFWILHGTELRSRGLSKADVAGVIRAAAMPEPGG